MIFSPQTPAFEVIRLGFSGKGRVLSIYGGCRRGRGGEWVNIWEVLG